MFFIMGINNGRKDLDFHQQIICGECGAYGRYQVYMTYMVLSFFFIPIFRWNRHYYVQTSCCGTVYELDAGVGREIERGMNIEITADDLTRLSAYGSGAGTGRDSGRGFTAVKICRNCGYTTEEDFEYCPKCGTRF